MSRHVVQREKSFKLVLRLRKFTIIAEHSEPTLSVSP